MSAEYEIERHPHGWLLCAPPGQRGIRADAFVESAALFPKKAIINPGIAHHFNASGYGKHVIFAVATQVESDAWEKEIAYQLDPLSPQVRWWRGTDVGQSSAALFHVFCDESLKWCSNEMGCSATPSDADDFGRCHRLLVLFPEWRSRLVEVAMKYPNTAWPKIVARWSELETAHEAALPEVVRVILRECEKA